MTIIEMLDKLAMVAPDVCQKHEIVPNHLPTSAIYVIGDYRFWTVANRFCAQLLDHQSDIQTGRPALAWLTEALASAIEARGWDYELSYSASNNEFIAEIINPSAWHKDKAEALLAALLAAIEGER